MAFNKFLEIGFGDIDLTNGTQVIVAKTLSAANLNPSTALKTDAVGKLISTDLLISDTTGLQAALDAAGGGGNVSTPADFVINNNLIRVDTVGGGEKEIQESIITLSDNGDFLSSATLQIKSTVNANNALELRVDGGLDSTIHLINESSNLGTGIHLEGLDDAGVRLQTEFGQLSLLSSSNTGDAILLSNTDLITGGINISVAGSSSEISLLALNSSSIGSINLSSPLGGIEFTADKIINFSTPSLNLEHKSTEFNENAMRLNIDLNSLSGIGEHIVLNSGIMKAGDNSAGLLQTIDDEVAVGGAINAVQVNRLTTGLATVTALQVGIEVDPISQNSGGQEDPEEFKVNGVSASRPVSIFVANSDTILVSTFSKYSEILITLGTNASVSIIPTFEYSTGGGNFAVFHAIDGTSGFRNSGVISWNTDDIPLWLANGSEFEMRVTRSLAILTTVPILDVIKLSFANDIYSWNKDGNIVCNNLRLTGTNQLVFEEPIIGAAVPETISIKIPTPMSVSYSLTLPQVLGFNGQTLTLDGGGGNLKWLYPNLPLNYVTGFGISNNSQSSQLISEGSCRSDDDSFNIISLDDIICNFSNPNGANGLDTGSESANQWYSVWIIADSNEVNPVASLFSESITSPTLPAGYNVKRRVNFMRNNNNSNIYRAVYGQNGLNRACLWSENAATLQTLVNGAATVYTSVDCSEFIPPISTIGYLSINHDGNNSDDFLTIAPVDLIPDIEGNNPNTSTRATRTRLGSNFMFMTFTNAGTVLYGNSSASEESDIYVIGYVDNLL